MIGNNGRSSCCCGHCSIVRGYSIQLGTARLPRLFSLLFCDLNQGRYRLDETWFRVSSIPTETNKPSPPERYEDNNSQLGVLHVEGCRHLVPTASESSPSRSSVVFLKEKYHSRSQRLHTQLKKAYGVRTTGSRGAVGTRICRGKEIIDACTLRTKQSSREAFYQQPSKS